MKRNLFFSAFATFSCFLSAASAAVTPTPVINKNGAVSSTGVSSSQRSQVHLFNTRLRNQQMLIQKGIRSGKLTKEQAEAMWASLKTARSQEVAFFKQNGHHELTSDQQSQLNGSLDKNSSTLGEPAAAN